MQLGTAAIDITPSPGVELCGYVAREQPSTGISDRLKARVLYLLHERQALLWVHLDLIGLEDGFVRLVKKDLTRLTGVREEYILLSATHTHSGPGTIHLNHCGAYDMVYTARLRQRIEEAAARAMSKLEPVTLHTGEGQCTLAVDRRHKNSAHTDPRVGILAWQRRDGSYAAVVANYAMHNVAFGPENREISGDVYGCAATTLEAALPGTPLVLMTNGACGNLNPPGHVETLREVEEWGELLAGAVLRGLANAGAAGELGIRSRLETVDVQLDAGDAEQIHAWAQTLRDNIADQRGYVADRVRASADEWETKMLERLENFSLPRHIAVTLQTLRIGPVTLVCLGAEAFSLFTDALRAMAPGPIYFIGYANGLAGYLPSDEAYREGGYEVEGAFIYYHSFRPVRSAFDTVLERAAKAACALR